MEENAKDSTGGYTCMQNNEKRCFTATDVNANELALMADDLKLLFF